MDVDPDVKKQNSSVIPLLYTDLATKHIAE